MALLSRAVPMQRVVVAVLLILAMVLGATPRAHAAPVQPTAVQFTLTNPDGGPAGSLTADTPYRFGFDFTVPAGTQPGDHFTVTLPPEFDVVDNSAAQLGGGTTATVVGNQVTVIFGEGVTGLINVRGHFDIIAQYRHTGTEDKDVNVTVTLGNETVYEQILKGTGPPPPFPMVVNKWSGYSTAPTNVNTSKALKLQTPRYNYQWINPVPGQVFAHWFIELNNWHGGADPVAIGQNIVITDRLAGMPAGFVPAVQAAEPGALTQAQLDEQLNGYYMQNFFCVAVRDNGVTTSYPTLNNLGQTLPFITFTGDSFAFRVSDYLASIGVHPSDKAQYAVNYFTLVPESNANVTNSATLTTDVITDGQTDTGWYKTVDTTGWIFGDQPTTSLAVTKQWEGANAPTPAVSFELLADGEPARTLTGDLIPALQFAEGVTQGEWTGLPTQSARGVPIVYSVKEVTVDGFRSTVSGTYTPDLADLANIPAGSITVTNTRDADTPVTSVTVTKVWNGLDAGETAPEVTFQLLAAVGDDFVQVPARAAVLAPGETTATWENLPVATDDGRAITYRVQEVVVPGFESTVEPATYTPDQAEPVPGAFTVTNTKVPGTPVDPDSPVAPLRVEKVWVGIDPADAPAITLSLLANGALVDAATATVTLPPGTTTHVWEDLPTEDADGKTIVYSVVETPVPGFRTTYSSDAAGSITVTNTREDQPGSSIPWWPLLLIPLIPLIGGSSTSSATVPDTTVPTVPVTEIRDPKAEKQQAPAPAPQRTLANTGADTVALGALALALVLGGVGVLLLRRRDA
ncbi:Cna B-type domain-containing protein [Corynebacterium nasicanis]|uniref:Cna B-type domain-containing protein n=1 Tax=Corynebacterium nasicanis TaxID=1448267 RepID=A0ABW1Q931_9CORY